MSSGDTPAPQEEGDQPTVTTHAGGAWAKDFNVNTSTPPTTMRRASTRITPAGRQTVPQATSSGQTKKTVRKRSTPSSSPEKGTVTSDKKKSKMNNRMASGGPIGGAIQPPVATQPQDAPLTLADLAALINASSQKTALGMTDMENRLAGKMDIQEANLANTNCELRQLKERVTDGEATLDTRIATAVDQAVARRLGQDHFPPLGGPATPGPSSTLSFPSFATAASSSSGQPSAIIAADPRAVRQEEDYWLCRRSLRLWPAPGPDLNKSVSEFLTSELEIEDLDDIGPFSVQRYQTAKTKYMNEVLVAFRTANVRDFVKAAAEIWQEKRQE